VWVQVPQVGRAVFIAFCLNPAKQLAPEKKKVIPTGMAFFFFARIRTRTHLNAAQMQIESMLPPLSFWSAGQIIPA